MMRYVTTVCPRDCYDTCALRVTLGDSDQILSIQGDSTHPVTQGFSCPRGAQDSQRLHKNRVAAPHVRHNGRLTATDWDTALDLLSDRLRQVLDDHGPEAVLYLDYAGNMGLLSTTFPQRLWHALGATQTDWALCSTSGHKALALHYGDSYGLLPAELASQALIVFWGFNAAVSAPHLWALAQRAREQHGALIAVVDPRQSRSAESADLWVQPRPGTDVALAYGVMDHLIRNDCIDRTFIEKWTAGYDRLAERARCWTPEKVESITQVPLAKLEQLAEAYAALRPSATMIGIGLQKCDQGADQVRAVSLIPALLGLHRGFFYGTSQAFSIDWGSISGQVLTSRRSKIVQQVALADLVQSGAFRLVHVNCMNPALTLPNQRAWRQGLEQDVFLSVHETHWSETAQQADLVLPAPTYLEKDDLVVPWGHTHIQFSHKVVPPVTDSRTEVWVMQELAKRLNLAESWLYEEPWDAIRLAIVGALEGGDLADLRSGARLTLRTKSEDHYATPSGRIEFHSSVAAAQGWDALPSQPPVDTGKGVFTWLTSAVPRYTHSQFQEVYGPIPAVVTMHPRDAAQLGLQEGDTVILTNRQAQVRVRVSISDSVPVDVLWSPRQWVELSGEPMNSLTSSVPQRIGGGPRFNSTKVKVSIGGSHMGSNSTE